MFGASLSTTFFGPNFLCFNLYFQTKTSNRKSLLLIVGHSLYQILETCCWSNQCPGLRQPVRASQLVTTLLKLACKLMNSREAAGTWVDTTLIKSVPCEGGTRQVQFRPQHEWFVECKLVLLLSFKRASINK